MVQTQRMRVCVGFFSIIFDTNCQNHMNEENEKIQYGKDLYVT